MGASWCEWIHLYRCTSLVHCRLARKDLLQLVKPSLIDSLNRGNRFLIGRTVGIEVAGPVHNRVDPAALSVYTESSYVVGQGEAVN